MKKFISLILVICCIALALSACTKNGETNPDDPVTLTMWHVYGSQTKSPLNIAIDEFNSTIGKEKGIIINVVSVTSSSAIDKALADAANNEPGAEELPDLFTAYPRVVELIGKDKLLAWDDYFSKNELSEYTEEFLSEGYFDEDLLMLPVAKSSELFYLNKTLFDKFSTETSYTTDDLKTFDRLFKTANAYYDWSGGQNFTQINDYYHYAYIGMKAHGSEFINNGKLNLRDSAFEKIWTPLVRCAIYGGICLDDGYAAARWKTIEIISNIGSTADVLYQPDKVIYGNNETVSIQTIAIPYPLFNENYKASVHRGGGLFALKNDDARKNYAAYIFAKWITEEKNNLEFVTSTGYLPVKDSSFKLLFENAQNIPGENFRNMYKAVDTMIENYELNSLPLFEGASELQHDFEENVKHILKAAHIQYENRVSAGESNEFVMDELVSKSLSDIRNLSEK